MPDEQERADQGPPYAALMNEAGVIRVNTKKYRKPEAS